MSSEDRDLTPAEARAEVEAFLGAGWSASVWCPGPFFFEVEAQRDDVKVRGIATSTLRAAVDALKQAWRDAVRPWEERAVEIALCAAYGNPAIEHEDVMRDLNREEA